MIVQFVFIFGVSILIQLEVGWEERLTTSALFRLCSSFNPYSVGSRLGSEVIHTERHFN